MFRLMVTSPQYQSQVQHTRTQTVAALAAFKTPEAESDRPAFRSGLRDTR